MELRISKALFRQKQTDVHALLISFARCAISLGIDRDVEVKNPRSVNGTLIAGCSQINSRERERYPGNKLGQCRIVRSKLRIIAVRSVIDDRRQGCP